MVLAERFWRISDMKLRELLTTLPDAVLDQSHPALEMEVKGLTTNSQACRPGTVFIGMPGTRVDGGDFWASAIAAGAIAAVISPAAKAKADLSAASSPCLVATPNLPIACAQLAAAFYGQPAHALKLIGVTGTNGKTTTTHLIEFLLDRAQSHPALFGTLYTRWRGFQQTAAHTTPFAVDLHQQFAEAVAAGCDVGVMEVSSHALAQGRVWGCPFPVAVFTNLTQDHLDYHKDMEDYFAAKALLFSPDYLGDRAIINQDDPFGRLLIHGLAAEKVWRYSTHDATADLWTGDLTYGADSVAGTLHTPVGTIPFSSPLVGQFNLANLLAAVGAVLSLGVDLETIVAALPEFVGVPGRMEQVFLAPSDARPQDLRPQDISVIVDYAHTPDSLENLLKAARPFIKGRMICVFGCGGDRDRTKRPLMGEIAARLADWAIVTSDNPRTEDPDRILADVVAGMPAGTSVMGDRAAAIQAAICQAQPGDGVLIAGKGHEDYQILGTEKVHFDDREQARLALSSRLRAVS
jgi:UDP-N-acetylmuramoyl-L-alanyl-D-glutamate--2,6-diaminopimelate ligase